MGWKRDKRIIKSKRERERERVCVCVCVRERERERWDIIKKTILTGAVFIFFFHFTDDLLKASVDGEKTDRHPTHHLLGPFQLEEGIYRMRDYFGFSYLLQNVFV